MVLSMLPIHSISAQAWECNWVFGQGHGDPNNFKSEWLVIQIADTSYFALRGGAYTRREKRRKRVESYA